MEFQRTIKMHFTLLSNPRWLSIWPLPPTDNRFDSSSSRFRISALSCSKADSRFSPKYSFITSKLQYNLCVFFVAQNLSFSSHTDKPEHIDSKYSSESQLFFICICSIRTFRLTDIKPSKTKYLYHGSVISSAVRLYFHDVASAYPVGSQDLRCPFRPYVDVILAKVKIPKNVLKIF